jgi:uncharacterized membrane protein
MEKNVGGMEKVRLLAGPALLAAGLKRGGGLGYLMAGAVLVATATIGYCPANAALGINTAK